LTQIEESDGLFNFDVEVKPLLNVLVNKTLAQALVEVKEEQEMQMLHRQHEMLKAEKRDAKQAERELEDKAKEANRRKELIKKKKAEKELREEIMRKKLYAWQFARPLVSQAIDQAAATLQKKGVFYDPMLRNLAIWLAGDVYECADDTIRLRALSTGLLDGTLAVIRDVGVLPVILTQAHHCRCCSIRSHRSWASAAGFVRTVTPK
jgi:hypothetical protein